MFIEEPEDPSIEEHLAQIEEMLKEHDRTDPRSVYAGLYFKYLQSPQWAALRRQVRRRDNHKCQHADGCRNQRSQVHHIRYPKVLGQEQLCDLITVCGVHHRAITRLSIGMDREKATWEVLNIHGKAQEKYRPATANPSGPPPGYFGEMPGLRANGKFGLCGPADPRRDDPPEGWEREQMAPLEDDWV